MKGVECKIEKRKPKQWPERGWNLPSSRAGWPLSTRFITSFTQSLRSTTAVHFPHNKHKLSRLIRLFGSVVPLRRFRCHAHSFVSLPTTSIVCPARIIVYLTHSSLCVCSANIPAAVHSFLIPCSILVDSAFRLLIEFVCLNWKFDRLEEFHLWVLKCLTHAMKQIHYSYKYLGFHTDQADIPLFSWPSHNERDLRSQLVNYLVRLRY